MRLTMIEVLTDALLDTAKEEYPEAYRAMITVDADGYKTFTITINDDDNPILFSAYRFADTEWKEETKHGTDPGCSMDP